MLRVGVQVFLDDGLPGVLAAAVNNNIDVLGEFITGVIISIFLFLILKYNINSFKSQSSFLALSITTLIKSFIKFTTSIINYIRRFSVMNSSFYIKIIRTNRK